MILNVSGRCDIVAFYSDWFMKRYYEGYVDVRNPFYNKNVSRIYFKDVSAILFCTKNPLPIIDRLSEIDKPILFHVTITPYKSDIEPNVISKAKIIEGIKKISQIIGKENIYVRYDPILLNDKYTIDYHLKAFDKLCSLLDGYVNHIIVSFIDYYKNVRNNMRYLKLRDFNESDYEQIAINFVKSASKHNITVQTCCEEHNLIEYGFIKQDCLSHELVYKLTGQTKFKKWKERPCNCIEMVDIGVYNCCNHFCRYCYANFDEKQVIANIKKHNDNSSMLIGNISNNDNIKIRNN